MKSILFFCCSLVAVGWADLNSFPAFAVNDGGDAVAVWQANVMGAVTIQAAKFDGMAWASAGSVSDPDSLYPDIALNDSGDIIGVWQTHSGIIAQIDASLSMFAGTFGTSMPIPAQIIKGTYAKIALDSMGNGVAVWQGTQTDGLAVFGSSLVMGNWTSPYPISTSSSTLPNPSLAVDPTTGNAIVLWQQLVGNFSQIRTASLPFGGTWSDPEVLSDETSSATHGQIAFSSSGKAIAIWQQDSSNSKTMAVRARVWSGSTWDPPVIFSEPSCQFSFPDISINSDGEAAAIWIRKGSDGQSIETVVYDPMTGEWGNPISLVIQQTLLRTPQIALNSAGEAVAVWTSEIEGKAVVQASTRSTGGIWASAETISDGTADELYPLAGIDGNGNAIAIWQDVATSTIQAARFSSSWSAPTTVGSL